MMNELIKQLAIKSGLACEDNGELVSPYVQPCDLSDDIEDFAKLIVRECAEFVKQRADFQSDLGIKTMLKITGQQVKEHFGVEE